MEFRQLRYFLAVAEDLHFTRAAERLHVAQPALSLQIRHLEEELGARLFDRQKHRVVLTPAGHALAIRARQILEHTDKAALEAAQIGNGQAGTLAIGFVSSAGLAVLPRILACLRQRMPHAMVDLQELDPTEQVSALRKGSIDAGFLHALAATSDIEVSVVRRDRLIACLPADHAAASRDRIDLEDLRDQTFLLPKRHEFGGIHEVVVGACHRVGFIPARIQSTRLLQTAVALVGGGLGVALVPESFRESMQIKGVVYRPLSNPNLEVELLAAWLRANDSNLLQVLKTFVQQGAPL